LLPSFFLQSPLFLQVECYTFIFCPASCPKLSDLNNQKEE